MFMAMGEGRFGSEIRQQQGLGARWEAIGIYWKNNGTTGTSLNRQATYKKHEEC